MKYHTLFLSKIKKDVANLSSAAVLIGALRANGLTDTPTNGHANIKRKIFLR